jgi:hypothetical protein
VVRGGGKRRATDIGVVAGDGGPGVGGTSKSWGMVVRLQAIIQGDELDRPIRVSQLYERAMATTDVDGRMEAAMETSAGKHGMRCGE